MARIKEEDLRLNLIINGDETRQRMGAIREEIEKSKKSIASLEQERKKLSKQYGEESIQVKNLDKSLNAHRNGLKNLQANYADYERRLSVTGMNMKELSSHARSVSAVLRNLTPNTREWKTYNEELKKTRDRMRELKNQSDSTGKAMQGMVGGLKAAYIGIVGVVYGISRAFSGAVNTMKDFEQANVNLSTILGVTTDQMKGLTDEALRLGGSTRYTATQVTALQTELAKLGFNQGQIKAMEEAVLNFATAVGAELPEAAALAGASLRMFELNSTDAEDTLAALAISTNKSALNFSYLQTALSIVGPVAKTFGFGIKDTTALLGALANAGFDASSAATATRNIFLKLADANGDLAKALGGPIKTFDELIAGMKNLSDSGIDLAGALELTDKRSVAAFTSFLSGADAAKELRNELELTDGALGDLATQRMNTLGGATLSLQSAWERFILSLRGSTGILKSITEGLTGIVNVMTDWVTGGQVRHENSVNALLEDLRFSFATDAEAAAQVEKELNILQGKAGDLQAKIDITTNKRERKQLEKELKNIEERISRGQDALGRLNIAVDESPSGTGGNTGSGNQGSGNGGNGSKKNWSLNSDESYLLAKVRLTKKYNEDAQFTEEQYLEAIFQAEQSAYKARLSAHKESGSARAKIEADMQNSVLKHNEEVQKRNVKAQKDREDAVKQQKKEAEDIKKMEQDALKVYASIANSREERAKALATAENTRFKEEIEKYEKKKSQFKDWSKVRDALELQHQNNLRKIRLDSIEEHRKEVETRHNTEIAAIKSRNAEEINLITTSSAEKLRLTRQQNRELAAENLAYLQEQANLLQKMVSSGRAGGLVTDPILSDEQLQQYRLKLQEILQQLGKAQAEVENLKGDFWGTVRAGSGGGTFLGVSQSDWDLLFQNIKDGTLGVTDLQNALSGIGGAAQEGFKLATQAINLTNAREKKSFDDWSKEQDKRKEQLKSRLDNGLVTQAQYDAEVEQMEKEKQAKEDKMKLDQAERQKRLSISQAIVNTALSVTKTYTQFGWPLGLIPASIMTAIGAAQIAMMSAQPTGYAKGGPVKVERAQDGKVFTASVDPEKRGYIKRPTILVGEEGGEYVIPAEGVNNPSIAPMLSQIESARRLGTLKSLNLEATYTPAPGYARGGYTVSGSPFDNPWEQTSSQSPEDGTLIIKKLDAILTKMDNPIPAIVAMTGKNGIEEALAERNRQRKTGKIGG